MTLNMIVLIIPTKTISELTYYNESALYTKIETKDAYIEQLNCNITDISLVRMIVYHQMEN